MVWIKPCVHSELVGSSIPVSSAICQRMVGTPTLPSTLIQYASIIAQLPIDVGGPGVCSTGLHEDNRLCLLESPDTCAPWLRSGEG